jgi:hydroxymethylglutaryl-CoA reductase
MKKDNTGQNIINVSMEEVSSFFKEARHPHTNMAKAALNTHRRRNWRRNLHECS